MLKTSQTLQPKDSNQTAKAFYVHRKLLGKGIVPKNSKPKLLPPLPLRSVEFITVPKSRHFTLQWYKL